MSLAAYGAFVPMVSVLVVDDDPDVREVVAYQLKLLGVLATQADGTEEALTALDTGQIDLVLTDIHLRGQDGRVLAAKCLDRGTPTILITAGSHPFAGCGNLQVLCKPIGLAELQRAIDVALGG